MLAWNLVTTAGPDELETTVLVHCMLSHCGGYSGCQDKRTCDSNERDLRKKSVGMNITDS